MAVHTDGWGGYAQVGKHGYKHKVTIIKEEGPQMMPRVHLVASLLKRWLLGTDQGAVSQAHLQAYIEKFCLRFNRRSSRSRGKLFFRIIEQAVRREPLPYAKIIKHSRPFQRPKKNVFLNLPASSQYPYNPITPDSLFSLCGEVFCPLSSQHGGRYWTRTNDPVRVKHVL